MTGKPFHTGTRALLIVGLVLVGLAAGILGMMIFGDDPSAWSVQTRVVERVQIGDPEPPVGVIRVDSSGGLPDIASLNQVFRQVADRVTPVVVYVQVQGRRDGDIWYHPFDEGGSPRFFQDDRARRAVGSGVLISRQGYVVTNDHVVKEAEGVHVTLADKRGFDACVVGRDPSTDLAVLKIGHWQAGTNPGTARCDDLAAMAMESEGNLPSIRLGDSDQVQVGEWVLAVGNPFRLTSTVTAGIVSAKGRQVNIIDDRFSIEDFIQTDAAINPGNSGGAVVNLRGELVGIATAIATDDGWYQGYGFAVPVNLMERVVTDIIEYGEVRRGYLGVVIGHVDAELAHDLGMDRIVGVHVGGVTGGGSADVAGIRTEDVILSVDDHPVNAPNELQSAIAHRRPGDMLAVRVWRDGQTQEFSVELQGPTSPANRRWLSELQEGAPEVPERLPLPRERPGVLELGDWGVGLRDVTRQEGLEFGVQEGCFIAYVEHDGPADRAGLPRGVVLVEVEGSSVRSTAEAAALLEEAARGEASVLVRVKRRDGRSAFYEIDVPGPPDWP